MTSQRIRLFCVVAMGLFAGYVAVAQNAGGRQSYKNPDQRGFSVLVEGQVDNLYVIGDVIGGYCFGPNVFVGAGVGTSLNTSPTLVPVFLDARFSFGDRRCAPYLETKAGMTALHKEHHGDGLVGLSAGVKIRGRDAGKRRALWIGLLVDEQIPVWTPQIGLKVGLSF